MKPRGKKVRDLTDPGEPLDLDKIINNVEKLRDRVADRFEGHSITKRADRLVRLAQRAKTRLAEIDRPRYAVRVFCAVDALLLILAVCAAVYFAVHSLVIVEDIGLADFVQGIEAGIGCTVFLGITLLFLASLEKRVRRREIMLEMDYLRNFLHLVNMGQLDKEPVRLDQRFQHTGRSPEIQLDAAAMERYLSHTQKLAHYAAELGCVYSNLMVDGDVERAAEHLREFASDVSTAASDKITVLVLRMSNNSARPQP